MAKQKIEVNEFDLIILLGVARGQTLNEICVEIGGQKKISFVQYRLNRLEDLKYVASIPGKARSRFLTDKGKAMVGQYDPKINDWRLSQTQETVS